MSAAAERLGAHAVVVGAGIAGLATALKLAPHPVILLTKAPLGEGSASAWAQGGIAASLGLDDSPAAHGADTLAVAGGIADPEIVAATVGAAGRQVVDLAALGVRFDRAADRGFRLGREGGHGRRRIAHAAGDGTGREIMRALIAAVRETASITLVEEASAEALVLEGDAVIGVRARQRARSLLCTAEAVVLATGGIGGLYRETSNPPVARGEGLALAALAGARLADLEFVQFHPTALAVGADPMPLATEALRGEGALLVDQSGTRFMPALHPDAELAPRDFVARAIWRKLQAGGSVYLDARPAIGAAFPDRFPTVYAACRAAGLDPIGAPLPVAPAAHYHMGGVAVDGRGRSSLPGLWAVGEVASTGLHGANRLASNSLLEALVFAERAAGDIVGLMPRRRPVPFTATRPASESARMEAKDWACLVRLRSLMTSAVGVERAEPGLRTALETFAGLLARPGRQAPTLRHAAVAALLITAAALERQESRGSHFRSDFPTPRPELAHRSFTTLADVEARAARLVRSDRALAAE